MPTDYEHAALICETRARSLIRDGLLREAGEAESCARMIRASAASKRKPSPIQQEGSEGLEGSTVVPDASGVQRGVQALRAPASSSEDSTSHPPTQPTQENET